MAADTGKAEALTIEVRACFNRLRALGDALHRDLGVTAAMRAVMESLHQSDGQTVSDVARAKNVSRQHIQVLVNALVEAGLVVARPNPADKRSPLVALAKPGRQAFARMEQREKTVLAAMTRALAGVDLDAALAALGALHAHLDLALKKGESDA